MIQLVRNNKHGLNHQTGCWKAQPVAVGYLWAWIHNSNLLDFLPLFALAALSTRSLRYKIDINGNRGRKYTCHL